VSMNHLLCKIYEASSNNAVTEITGLHALNLRMIGGR
jgi:hypothetical protein